MHLSQLARLAPNKMQIEDTSPMKPAAKTTPARPHPEPLSRCVRALDWLRRTCPSNSPGTMGLLAAGLLVTVLVTLYVKSQMEADARRDFVFACHEIQLSLDARLAANARVHVSFC